MGGVRSVREKIAPEVICSVIDGERGFLIRVPFKASRSGSGVHHGRAHVGSRGVRTNNQLRSVRHQIACAAVAPKSNSQESKASGQLEVRGYLAAPTHGRMRVECCSPDRHHGGPRSRNQADSFQVEMSASNFCVVSDFRKDIRKKIGGAYLGSVVKLGTQCRAKCCW